MAVPYKLNYFEIETGIDATSTFIHTGDFTATKIIKSLGTSNDILLGDGTTTLLSGKQDTLSGTGIVKSTSGVITYLTDNSTNWNTAYNDSIVSASITGTSTKTLTLTQQDAGTVTASWTDLGLTSVGLTMPSAFNVANSPLTANGTLAVTAAGLASQYIRGDGELANLPSGGGGGGSSVSYYLNGSVSQGTFGGNAYYEMSKTPVLLGGTDFTISSNGYIAQFITDANDPNALLIPGGNFNLEFYFNASSGGGTPSFYTELYKYNGTTFTLIASNSVNPEIISLGTVVTPYFSNLAVPETILTATDRLAIRIYVNNSGRTITLHTEDSNLCQVITTFTTGLQSLNGLSKQAQFFATGSTGTDFNISSVTDTHTFNIPTASASNRGLLSSSNWTTFNNKQNTITLTTTGSSGSSTFISNTLNVPTYTLSGLGGVPTTRSLTINGTAFDLSTDRTWSVGTVTSVAALTLGTSGTDLSSSVANGTTTPIITLNVPTASALNRGVLSSTDWSTFNGKQNAITLTTTGSSGAATLIGSTLNIPNYGSALSGYLPLTGGTLSTTNTSETLRISNGGTGYSLYVQGDSYFQGSVRFQAVSNSLLKTVSNVLTAAVAGTDYVIPSALSAYLPLAGGTLTGTLNGTSASFSGIINANSVGNNIRIKADGTNSLDGFVGSLADGTLYLTNWSGTRGLLVLPSGTISLLGALSGTSATFSGNVGIGTTSPSLKTEIMGVNGLPASSGTSQIGVTRFSQTAGQSVMDAFVNGSVGAGFQVTNSSNLALAYPFILQPNGGNVLIGTTTDAGYKLDVNGTGRVGGNTSSSPFELANTTISNYMFVNSTTGNEAMSRYYNPTAGNWYTGIRANAGLGSTSSYHIYSSTYGADVAVFNTDGTSKFVGAATFSSSVTSSIGFAINRTSLTSSNPITWQTSSSNDWFLGSSPLGTSTSDLSLYSYGTSSVVLNIVKSTGAATFASTVTATSFNLGNGQYLKGTRTSGGLVINLLGIESGTDRTIMTTTGDYVLQNGSNTALLTMTTAGVATFLSSVTATAFFESSDSRLKTLISDNYNAVGIESILPRLYEKGGVVELGYYAQDVQEVLPSAVVERMDGFLDLSYRQVHTAKIANLENRIKQLEDLIKQLL